jgi:chromosome segregation ATPase
MTDTIDKRVADLEAIVTDLPEVLNLRFERVDATLSEHSARFNLLDKQMAKQMAMLARDMRDLRGGVRRQLVEQDRRLGGIQQKLGEHDRRLGAIEERLEGQDRRLGGMEQQLAVQDRRLATMESDVAAIKADVAEVLRRLPKS